MDTIDHVGPNRKKVRDALNQTKDASTMIGKVTFDDHRQNVIPLISKYVVQDGKWVLWEDSAYAKKTRKLTGM
jgi:branched-chain amino acid transport system substrate-binding protein